jgi:hypothetical protein
MSPRNSALRTYMDTHNAMPPDTVLGYIAWFSIPEAPYDAEKMVKDFDRLKLRTDLLPPPLRADDAFEKASNACNKSKYSMVGGIEAEVLCREAGRDDKTITRRFVREAKDGHNRRLAYGEVADLVFYKAQERFGKVDPATVRCRATLRAGLPDAEKDPLLELIAKFEALYNQYSNFHDAQKVRVILRGYMKRLDALMWKSSFYFVPAEHREELERLTEWVNDLAPGAEMDLIPLVDLPHLRDRVVEVYQREAESGLEEVSAEIAKLLGRRQIKTESFERVMSMYKEWTDRAGKYTESLQVSKDRTAGAAEAVRLQLAQLQNTVVSQMSTVPAAG